MVKPKNDSDYRTVSCRNQECTLGNLIADSIKESGNSQISLINGGSIKNNMCKGDITYGQLIDIFPSFNNKIVVKNISGQCLLDALEFGVSKLPNPSGAFPQVSGIKFYVNINYNSTVSTNNYDSFVNITGKRRVYNVTINGENLDEHKYYNISLNEFISNGGYGYSMFEKLNIINTNNNYSLPDYINNTLRREIPPKYNSLEGRIKISNNIPSFPSILLIGFDSYNIIYNDSFKFLTYLKLDNYIEYELNNITLIVDIIPSSRLRFLEEFDINCPKIDYNNNTNIYIFNCSQNVNRTISKISYKNLAKINGQNNIPEIVLTPIAEFIGDNIQNYKCSIFNFNYSICYLENSTLKNIKEQFLINGYNDKEDLNSSDSELFLGIKEELKNFSCNISKIDVENQYQIVCNSNSTTPLKEDSSYDNFVNLKDREKTLFIKFNPRENPVEYKKKSGKLSAGAFVGIVVSCIAILIIIITLAILFGPKRASNPESQKMINTVGISPSSDSINKN